MDMTEKLRHSVKVPRLFKTASKIAKVVREEGGSLKEQVYSGKHPNIKALYALVVETLQHEKDLNTLLKRSKILEQEKKLDPWLARVLITELLWGKRRLSGESKPVKTVLSYQSSFKISSEGNDNGGNRAKDVEKVSLPRYVRVNTLYMTVEQAVNYFRDEGWILARDGDKTLFPSSDHFRRDSHVPELLAFPPRTELHQHPLYKDKSILLQDKASCLAAHLLSPPSGSIVLDMCAAPGMKTTHLAALMENEGTLYAVEKDPKRYETLCNFIEESGATCVKPLLGDSVQLKDESVPDVEYILVDPSCSGSGMVRRPRIGAWETEDTDGVRLRKLVGFQKRLLCHALSGFPKARKVLYSTCSLLRAENEEVVSWAVCGQAAMDSSPREMWQLVKDPLPGWSNRGCEEKFPGIGEHCLYSHAETDLTNGFFMAVFERDLQCNKEQIKGHGDAEEAGDAWVERSRTKKKKKKQGVREGAETAVADGIYPPVKKKKHRRD